MIADTLIVLGLATVSLGTIHEADGVRQQQFWLRNDGRQVVILGQGYTSCGCTTIVYERGTEVAPGDSTAVTLRFNPAGKGGDFHETATLKYGPATHRPSAITHHPSSITHHPSPINHQPSPTPHHLTLSLTGTCITSEETLLRQFPVHLGDSLRLSANHFDLGRMRHGEIKERTVVVLHQDEGNRRETITIGYQADATATGLQHVERIVTTTAKGQPVSFTVTFDVIILQ